LPVPIVEGYQNLKEQIEMSQKTHEFQTEAKELLNLMIHSLYSHREIFLRELISNASDAIDKLKYEAITNTDLAYKEENLEIRLIPDQQKRTLTIRDTGIGMTQEEVIENIGRIARSGTKEFLKKRQELKDSPELIGQFGVGFYSAFMVADKVTLHTQKVGTQEGVLWESDANGTYTIDQSPRPEGHGTTITLHLKEPSKDEDETSQDFTEQFTLRGLVKKYSDFIAHPIKLNVTREEEKDGKKEFIVEDETLNSQKALWLRAASEISKEEYAQFYQHISHDWSEPLKTVHFKAEGVIEFTSLLYIPSQKPFNYDYRDFKRGLQLYVKRVFIMDECEELIPPYLRFMKGLIDSSDLTLNVSREMLQKDHQAARMRKAVTNKIFGSLKEMLQNQREDYVKFWNLFGPTLKEAIPTDPAVKDKVQDLLLFRSSHSNESTTLKEYVERMKPDQKSIYFLTGDSLDQLKQSPYLEQIYAKGYEVIFMTDHIDEWVGTQLGEYDGKKLLSASSEDLELESEEEKKSKEEEKKADEQRLKPLLENLQSALEENVREIKLSDRLTESPVCLVSASTGPSAHMERMMEAMGQKLPPMKRVLEINSKHPLFESMLGLSPEKQKEWAEVLYDQALLNEGGTVSNPQRFAKKMSDIMISASKSFQ
jgi:molecular chaperone HtpG